MGLSIADPRAHDLIDVTIDEVEALIALEEQHSGGELLPRVDRTLIDRLIALDLLIGRADPARAPALATPSTMAITNQTIDRASICVVTPSVVRLHEGQPLAWDRGSGVYRRLSAAHLRLLSDIVHQIDTGAGRPRDVDLAQLLSVGLIEFVEPETDRAPTS